MSTGCLSEQEDQTTKVIMEGRNLGTPSSSTDSGSAIVDGDISGAKSGAKSYANVLECFICMEPPPDPVAASCGHVFCWPCMYLWLQNQPKPCPVCRHLLRRDLDIIPLHGAGDQARAGGSIRITSNSNPGEITSTMIPNADNDDNIAMIMTDIPPRPRNPLVVNAAPIAILETPTDQLMLTPSSVLSAYERSLQELSDDLVDERMRVRHLTTERANLELAVHDKEQRNATLRRQVQETDWQILRLRTRREQLQSEWKERNARLEREVGERWERDRRLVHRQNEMGTQIQRLQQRLAQAQALQ